MAVINLVVLGVLDDLENLLDSMIDIGTGTTDKDDIDAFWITSLCADLDRKRLIFADDAVDKNKYTRGLKYHR